MSLRLRLLAGLAVLVISGLAAFGAGTYISLEHFLVQRLDQQLRDAATGLRSPVPIGGPTRDGPTPVHPPDPQTVEPGLLQGPEIRGAVGPDLFVEILRADPSAPGVVLSASRRASAPKLGRDAVPVVATDLGIPSDAGNGLPGPHRPGGVVGTVRIITTASESSGDERVALFSQPGSSVTIAIAGSLHPVTRILHRLLFVEFGIGAGVLLVTLGLGVALARQATQPLEVIAATADAIAGGDLGRRVTGATDSSEVGRVGLAINAMLNEIEGAFNRRDASEARLRRFVADASHELATPLTSIRGYAELFHRGLAGRPEDLAKAMQRIEAEGTRMGALVDDLLLLASMDNGRPLEHDPVDLARIVSDTAADLRAAAPDRSVTVESDGAVIVVGDENRLRQVAANLASNARRHTPPGTPIVLRARRKDPVGVLEVSDRGPGLTAEAAAHVFERFYRVDKARARADGGTGLGLSIVAAIAEALDGHASLVTAEGDGATFSVAVPLARA